MTVEGQRLFDPSDSDTVVGAESAGERGRPATWWRPYAATAAASDAVAMGIAAAAAQAARFKTLEPSAGSTSGLQFGVATVTLCLGWLLALALGGAYQRRILGAGSEEYRRVLDSALRLLAAIAIAALVVQAGVTRPFILIVIGVATATSLVFRYLMRRWFHRQRIRGRFVRRAFVVGDLASAREIVRSMGRNPHAGLAAVAACIPGHRGTLEIDGTRMPVVTNPELVLEGVLECGADAVIIADTETIPARALRELAWKLEGTGVAMLVTPAVTDLAGPRIAIRQVPDLPLLHVEEPHLKGWQRLTKEVLDKVLAGAALLVLAPVMLMIALAIRLTSRGPALFQQVRVGVGGRHFTMLKFRSMRHGAEALLPGLAHLNELDGVLFKIRNDPRITPVGRVLRRWSLDELPQLLNVLKGDMSVVGPRPPLPSEVDRYSHDVRRRLLVKPGLTGLWQVSGRAGVSWEEAVRLDLYYVEQWSLSMDAMIIARTLSAVLRGHGAC